MLEHDLENLPTNRFLCRDNRWCVARAENGTKIIVMEFATSSVLPATARISLLPLRDCHGTNPSPARNSCRRKTFAVPERWKSGSTRKKFAYFAVSPPLVTVIGRGISVRNYMTGEAENSFAGKASREMDTMTERDAAASVRRKKGSAGLGETTETEFLDAAERRFRR